MSLNLNINFRSWSFEYSYAIKEIYLMANYEQKYIAYGNPIQIALSLFIVIQLKTYQKNKTTLFEFSD